ncbi:MAG: hypothetical protein IMW91_00510 [Firmicutes bacterium]|nr:hypothetical protein [Bacillota bacterium]
MGSRPRKKCLSELLQPTPPWAQGIATARYALLEAFHNRTFLIGGTLGIAFLALYGIGLHLLDSQLRQRGASAFLLHAMVIRSVVPMALWIAALLITALGSVLGAGTLAGDLEQQTALATLARPLRRDTWLYGKLGGSAALLFLVTSVLVWGIDGLTYDLIGEWPLHLFRLWGLLVLQAGLVFGLAALLATRLSGLTAVIATLLLYGVTLIGGLLTAMGSNSRITTLENIGTVLMLLFPANGLTMRATYFASGANPLIGASPFAAAGTAPSAWLTGWAAAYTVAVWWGCHCSFQSREIH